MSQEVQYESYEIQTAEPAASNPLFWPFCILALSLILLLGWQLSLGMRQRTALEQQIAQRADVVRQSQMLQGQLQKIAMDLIALGESDPEAKAIVQKYGIARQPNPPAKP